MLESLGLASALFRQENRENEAEVSATTRQPSRDGMSKTGLAGPYRLTFEGIDSAIARKSAGVFALGRIDPEGKFCVNHVGRCDSDVKSKLREYIGSDHLFKYGYFSSTHAAFNKECEIYHDFGPPATRVHPGRAPGTTWECPRCRIFARRG
jgi:hypothetical protein